MVLSEGRRPLGKALSVCVGVGASVVGTGKGNRQECPSRLRVNLCYPKAKTPAGRWRYSELPTILPRFTYTLWISFCRSEQKAKK